MANGKFPLPRPCGDRYEAAYFPKSDDEPGDTNACHHLGAAVTAMRRAWRESWEHMERRQKDEILNENMKLLRSAQFARQAVARANAEYDRALGVAGPEMARLKGELSAYLEPPTTAGRAQIASEIRGRLAGMKSADDRRQAVQEALDADQTEVVHAVLSAPSIVSGLPPELHQRLKDKYLSKVAPDKHAAAARLEVRMKEAATGFAALADHNARLLDWKAAEALEKGAKDPEAVGG